VSAGTVALAAAAANPLWLATRACGTAALVLLTAAVALGIAVAGRHEPRRLTRFEIGTLHRNLSLLTLAFLTAHITTAVLDTYVHLGWLIALVPLTSSYRTLWLSLGTVAFDALLAVSATSALRLRLGQRRWKAVHWAGYLSWPVAMFHAAGTGSDTRLTWQLALYGVCLAVVAAACGWRISHAGPGRVAVRLGAALATVLIAALLVAFVATGPLRPGWSHRADPPAPPSLSASSIGGEG
jgi:sulfoxide reductase heme-binding subunit YedZ